MMVLMAPKQHACWLAIAAAAILTLCGETSQSNVYTAEKLSDFSDVNISALLNSFQLGYDKRVRPNYGGPAVIVGVSMYVLSISSLLEVQMDFTLDMYFRQFWVDPRLSFDAKPNLKKLVVGAEYIKKIWVPDTFFVNEKTAYFHEATAENQFLRILHTGEILRSIRLTITASCPMALQYFPMDRQMCFIEIESFGYTMSDIHYKWNDGLNSVQISPDVSLPQFKVIGHRQKTIEASLTTGNYSRLACEILFVRSMGYYLIQIYIPSSLIVVISWVSFWFNRGASVARVNLGVTTVLTMTTLMASTNAALPKISYVKSIDVYLGACFFMVFASLIEYASVGYIAKRIQMRKNRYLASQNKEPEKIEGAGDPAAPTTEIPKDMLAILQKLATKSPGQQQHQQHNLRDSSSPSPSSPHRHHHHHHNQQHRNSNRSYHSSSNGGNRYTPIPQHRMYDVEAPPPPLPPPVAPVAPAAMAPPLPPPNPDCELNKLNKMFGITASDIDKYSRIFFPVTFTCFQLMYWIIYQHLSDEQVDDLVYLQKDD